MRDRLACEFIEQKPDETHVAVPAINEDPETLAAAIEAVWFESTIRSCPATGLPLRAAIRDCIARHDDRWASFDPDEKARQLVIACLRAAGVKKPSSLFDAERKSKSRRTD